MADQPDVPVPDEKPLDETAPPRAPLDETAPSAPGLEATARREPGLDATVRREPELARPALPAQPLANARPLSIGGELVRGETVGRFLVVGSLGRGGMGTVLLAYDPELDRRVALKFVLAEASGEDEERRLRREAQALAKVAHPNVVQVLDVGRHAGRVWVALEFVAGGTLGSWMAAAPRPWREVVGMWVEAGRGLEAAHAAGLIHRDFKPANVLLDATGRPRVADFGLASRDQRSDLPASLEATQAAGGTPAYMAPEQFAGGEVGPAADQFAFCSSLWEALLGERPFAGDDYVALRDAVLAGRLRAPPAGARVPERVLRLLRRGLATKAEERHPSMAVLLAALRRGQRFSWRRVGAFAMGAVGLAAVIGGLGRSVWLERTRCARETDERAPDYAALLRALPAHAAALPSDLPPRIVEWAGRESARWHRERLQACEAARVDPVAAHRLACLDDSAEGQRVDLVELERLEGDSALNQIRLLVSGDGVGLECPTLSPVPIAPAATKAENERAETQLREAMAISAYEQVERIASAMVGRGLDSGLPAVEARGREWQSVANENLGRQVDEALEASARTVRLFDAAGDDSARARVLTTRLRLLWGRQQRREFARALEELEFVVRRLGAPPRMKARLLLHQADLVLLTDLKRSSDLAREAVALLRAEAGPLSDDLGLALERQGQADMELVGRVADGEAALREAEAIELGAVGRQSNGLFALRLERASSVAADRRFESALELIDLAWRDFSASPARLPMDEVVLLDARANVLMLAHRDAEAWQVLEAERTLRAALPEDSAIGLGVDVQLWVRRSLARLRLGDAAGAAREAERAREVVAAAGEEGESFAAEAQLAHLGARARLDPGKARQELRAWLLQARSDHDTHDHGWDLLLEELGYDALPPPPE